MNDVQRYVDVTADAGPEASRVLTTLLFTDIVDSTRLAADLGDRGWMGLIERHHAAVRELFAGFDGREVDCAGDGFFATFETATSAIRCGDAIRSSVGSMGLEVRAGMHTGECERVDGRVRGIAVAHRGPAGGTRATRRGLGHGDRAGRGRRLRNPVRGARSPRVARHPRCVAALRRHQR